LDLIVVNVELLLVTITKSVFSIDVLSAIAADDNRHIIIRAMLVMMFVGFMVARHSIESRGVYGCHVLLYD